MAETPASTQTDRPNSGGVIRRETAGAGPANATVTDASASGVKGGVSGRSPEESSNTNKYGVAAAAIITIALLLGFLLWLALMKAGSGAEKYPISWFIIIAAILGSVLNEPFRQGEPYRLTYGWITAYIFWKGAISIVFGFILYLMAVGGLIGGDMFPKFVPLLQTGAAWTMESFVTQVKPETYKDIAKILVWSFVAGYSEKFVPNLIGQILKAAETPAGPSDRAKR